MKFLLNHHRSQRGATLVEVLVAIGLTGIMLPTLATALVTSHAGKASSLQQLSASALLHQNTEAVRVVREQGWSNVATDGTYHTIISGSTWALAGGADTSGGFTRQVVISPAQRDSGGALVASGGTNDPAAKHVVVTISWTTPYSASISGDIYLTRWSNNAVWQQTAQSDLNAGTLTNTATTNVSGGEVQLAGAGPFQTSGTFESSTFDATADAAFNSLSFTSTVPAATTLQLQIATNSDNSTWNYVGPDGTSGTFYAANGPIPLTAADGRYLRYKAFFTGSGSATAVLSDAEVNYSL